MVTTKLKPTMTNLSDEALVKINEHRLRNSESVASYIRRAVMEKLQNEEEPVNNGE